MRSGIVLCLALAVAIGLGTMAEAGTFIPSAVTDVSATNPLANPSPTNLEPRYISGIGSNDTFTVFFEDRMRNYGIYYASTVCGATGLPETAVSCSITSTHFCASDLAITFDGTNYAYRGWGCPTSFNRDHYLYVANELSNWIRVATFRITNAPGFTGDGTDVAYGFHDVVLINGTYYGWVETLGGATCMARSPDGATNWEVFASAGGNDPTDGPLWFAGGNGPLPTGNFIDLGHDRGFGKVHVHTNWNFYLAVNTEAKASLAPAAIEAAFIQPTNWTWYNGTTGNYLLATSPIVSSNDHHKLRECWTVPQTDPDAPWIIIYNAEYASTNGARALGYATLTPPSLGAVHNVTKDLYYDTIQAGINAADDWDFIQVGPGSFGPFVLNKRLVIEGSGSTDNPAVSTVVTGGTPTIQLQVGGTSATDRVELRSLHVTGGTGGVPLNEDSGVEIQGTADIGHVTFSNVTFASNAGCGIAVDFSYNLSDIVVRDCIFRSNAYYGIRLPTGLNCWDLLIEGCLFTNNLQGGVMSYAALTNVVFRDSIFAGNAPGVDQLAEIVLSPFNGDAEFSDLVFIGNNADAAIRLSGTNTAKMAGGPCGDLSFSNITIQGTYSHAAIQLSRYTTMTSVTFNNVELASASPVGLHLGTVNGQLDAAEITFSGANSQGNIVLGRHGDGYATPSTYSNAAVGVDATAAIFTGAANNWEIEDRIVHGPDAAGLGTVTWITGNVFVTPDSGSVGRGIEAASPGDTVTVAPGTYTQHTAAVISNAVTVRSEGGDCGAGVILTGTNGIFRIADGASGVTIQGFRFVGVTGDDCISGDAPAAGQNNVTILSNCFENIEYAAIDASSNDGPNSRTNWLVAVNVVDGVTGYPNSGFRFMALQDSLIVNNTIAHVAYNGMTLEALVNVQITGNLVSNTYACGIQVANSSAAGATPFYSTNVVIAGNTILNANTNHTADKGAVSVYPDVAGVLVSGNRLTGNYNGFTVRDKTNALSDGVRVTENNIYGNAGYGAANFAQGGGTLDAVSNWWGSYAGPGLTDGGGRTGDAVNAGVGYSAWTYGKYGTNYDGDGLADPDDPDDDNDGYGDVEEVASGSDPLNLWSIPQVRISGDVIYSGSQTGLIHVYVAFAHGYVGFSHVVVTNPGLYVADHIPIDSTCETMAYRDSNGNASNDPWEASGIYAGNPFFVTNDTPGIDIPLADNTTVDTDGEGLPDYDEVYTYHTDPFDRNSDDDAYEDDDEIAAGTDPLDPASFPATIAGTVGYAGSQTGTVYVIVSNASVARAISMADLGPYAFTNLPTLSNYWVRAYRDSNGNTARDTWEASGDYAGNPLRLTNDEPAIDLSLADPTTDTDSDGLTDYDEIYVTGTDPYDDDCDDDGLKDGVEVNTHSTNPWDPDTEHDGLPDGWEVGHSLNPLADDAEADPDSDDLVNSGEYAHQTDPQDADTDNDQFEDGDEVFAIGSNPNNALDPVVVDDNAAGDPGPGDPTSSDPAEDGSAAHPYDAIQEGIGDATNRMVVLVLDGTYSGTGNRDIDPGGKAIAVRSRTSHTNTFIEASPARGFVCDSAETTGTVIRGFSVRTAAGLEGFFCDGGSPRIRDCRAWDCSVGLLCTNGASPVVEGSAFESASQGGVRAHDSSPRLDRCLIVSNSAGLGAGVCAEGSSAPFMVNCLVAGNQSADEGGGLYLGADSFLTNIHCTIAGNSAANRGGGLSSASSAAHLFRNTVLHGNTAGTNEGFFCATPPDFEYCCLQDSDPGAGNTTNNPLFAGAQDYRLSLGSPAIDAGMPAFDSGIDLLGVLRPLDGDSNGVACADMGAYEFWHPSVDTDGDGLLDQQEVYTYFTDPTDADTDGDSFADGVEVAIADTRPLVRNSCLRIVTLSRTNSFRVTFSCTNSRNYSLEYSDALVSGAWLPMPEQTNLPGQDGGVMSLIDSNPPPVRAYRVGVHAP